MRYDESTARRLHLVVEPVHLVAYFCDEPRDELLALGLRNDWDAYFAGRAAPLGPVPAEVVHALFYNFADGEVARHVPRVWDLVTPEQALTARRRGCVSALRRILGERADDPGVTRASDVLLRAATTAPTEGRALYAAHRVLPVPDEPVARLWHAATLLREHRGDGHNAVLVAEGVGGTEAHVLHALSEGMRAHESGRVGHLPAARLEAVVDGLRERGLVGADGWLTDAGRSLKARIETRTDALAAPAYDVIEPDELEVLLADLAPIAATLDVALGI